MSLVPFDDRDGWIWFDGRMLAWRDAKVHVLTHSLHYASSVFEGIRVYAGRVFKLQEHLERLVSSAQILGYKIPYAIEDITKASLEVIEKNSMTNCYLRPIAWRGAEQMGLSARQTRIHLAIAVWEWPSYFTLKKGTGLKLVTASWRRPDPRTSPVKSKAACHYAISTLAKHAAEDAGYHDSLMLGFEGNLAEATGANIFFVAEGKIHTPIPDCFLDGITRRTVIDLAKKRGVEVIERVIRPDELKRFQEAFLTGTAAEVTPVEAIDHNLFKPGQITEQLQADYHKLTGVS